MDELKNQREKMAKWNDQRAKSEEAGLKNFFRMKEVFSQQKIISSNPPVIGSVCRCSKCGCEIKNDVGDKLCAECWSAN